MLKKKFFFFELPLYLDKVGLAQNLNFILKCNTRIAKVPLQTVLAINIAVKPNHCLESVDSYPEKKLTTIFLSY